MTVTPAVFTRPRICACGVAWVGSDPECWNCAETVLPSTCLPAPVNPSRPRECAVGEVLVL